MRSPAFTNNHFHIGSQPTLSVMFGDEEENDEGRGGREAQQDHVVGVDDETDLLNDKASDV